MPYGRISEETKWQIVAAFNREEDYIEVARILGVKRTTAYGIVRRHQENGAIVRPRGGARLVKVDEDMKNCLVEIVEENAAFTLQQVIRINFFYTTILLVKLLVNFLYADQRRASSETPQQAAHPRFYCSQNVGWHAGEAEKIGGCTG